MKTNKQQLKSIHDSLINGQRRQMAAQIDEYGLYYFWSEYLAYLKLYTSHAADYFEDTVVSYHRIKFR